MKKGKNLRLFWSIIKKTNFDKILCGFFGFYLICALLILVIEPSINSYGDALWYCFVSSTSIGFGDFYAITLLGRLVTVVLTIYEIVLISLFSGVVVAHFLEVIHRREKLTATVFIDRMEHLTELSQDELLEMQEEVKKLRIK